MLINDVTLKLSYSHFLPVRNCINLNAGQAENRPDAAYLTDCQELKGSNK